MTGKTFAIVGTWMFKPVEKGVCVYEYDPETAKMTFVDRYDTTVAAGQQYYDPKRGVVYVVDECDGHPGEIGGGGFARAYKLDPETGKLSLLNERRVPMTKPSYIWLDESGDWALVSCHTGRSAVTKVVYLPDGSFTSALIYEDAGLVLLKVEKDGSLGKVCDVALYDGLTDAPGQVHAHLHSVMADPKGKIFFSCDKGLDRIYSYKIDKERGRILRMAETKMDYATAPRYVAFHPTLPVLYENNETSNYIFAMAYDAESGALRELCRLPLMDDPKGISPSDLRVSKDGRFLYCAVRGVDKLVVYALDEKGIPSRIQIADCPGGPRGIWIAPDGRFLLSANNSVNEIRAFAIAADGTLTDAGVSAQVDYAANVGIYEV